MNHHLFAFAGAISLLLVGCASTKPKPTITTVIAPAVTYSAPPTPRPSPSMVTTSSDPVYINPKIRRVELAPYQDERGRLYSGQTVYEIEREGQWNVAALENPDRAIIPPENIMPPPGYGSQVSRRAMQDATAVNGATAPLDTLDPREIVPLGLFSRSEDAVQARRMAAARGMVAEYDTEIGWFLRPAPTSPPSAPAPAQSTPPPAAVEQPPLPFQ